MELLIATHNRGKILELQRALRDLPITLRYLSEFPALATIDETGQTYEENAILKALGYADQTGICALGDDSGLEVDALGGKPGVRSARFGGADASDKDRTHKLLSELTPYQERERTARFVCCMALAGWRSTVVDSALTPAEVLNVSEGICEGRIAQEPRGAGGFGYDPIFVPQGYGETFGELSKDVKARLSHRAKALAAMRGFLISFVNPT